MMNWTSIPWLPAIAVLLYMAARRQTFVKIAEAIVRMLIGYALMLVGTAAAQWALSPLDGFMVRLFAVHGGVLNTEVFGTALLNDYGGIGFAIMLLSFTFTLIVAALSKHKYLYMTAHHMMFLSLMVAMLLKMDTSLSDIGCMLVGAAVMAVYMFTTVLVTRPFMKRLTGTPMLGMGNSASFASVAGGLIGRLFRKSTARFDAEETTLKFGFPEISFASAALIFTAYTVFCLMAGADASRSLLGAGQHWLASVLLRTVIYGAALSILLKGISEFLGKIIEAFMWLNQRFVRGAVMGIDASAVIPYSPKAWMDGFLSCSAAGIIAAAGLLVFRAGYVPLIGLTSFYFVGGVAGVFGNAYGGKRGAIVASAFIGVLTVVMCSVFMTALGGMDSMGFAFGETEYSILGGLLRFIFRNL